MRIRKRQDPPSLGRDEAEAISYLLEGRPGLEAIHRQLKGLRAFERVGGGWAVIELDVDPGAPAARDLPRHYGLGSIGKASADGARDPDLTLHVEEGMLRSLTIRSYDSRLMPACPVAGRLMTPWRVRSRENRRPSAGNRRSKSVAAAPPTLPMKEANNGRYLSRRRAASESMSPTSSAAR